MLLGEAIRRVEERDFSYRNIDGNIRFSNRVYAEVIDTLFRAIDDKSLIIDVNKCRIDDIDELNAPDAWADDVIRRIEETSDFPPYPNHILSKDEMDALMSALN